MRSTRDLRFRRQRTLAVWVSWCSECVSDLLVPSHRREFSLHQLTDPDDADLESVAALLLAVFPDPNTVLGLDRLLEFLGQSSHERVFNVLAAKESDRLVGCAVFSYVPVSNCGFSEYIAVTKNARGGGLGRKLFDARRGLLDQHARATGRDACRGLFIEADSPARVPTELLKQERTTAIDAEERLRVFAHFGFKRVDIQYVQPPLGYGKEAVTYLDLLFAPWAEMSRAIEAEVIVQTLEPVWRAWSPQTYQAELDVLRSRLTRPTVALMPLRLM